MPEQRQAVNAAIRDAGKHFVSVEFSDADHGFFCDQRVQYSPYAAAQSWVHTLAFLGDYLSELIADCA